jgi:hypothetical protein
MPGNFGLTPAWQPGTLKAGCASLSRPTIIVPLKEGRVRRAIYLFCLTPAIAPLGERGERWNPFYAPPPGELFGCPLCRLFWPDPGFCWKQIAKS